MQAVELAALDWLQANCRTAFLDWLMPAVSALCNNGEIWIALAAALLLTKKYRRTGAVVALALLLDLLCCNAVLKPLTARPRPCDVNTAAALLTPRLGDWSFPSGHTAASMAAVGALLAEGSRLWVPALALTVLIAFSRLYLYLHWPSDVLAGAVLGAALGFAASRIVRRIERERGVSR